MLRRAQNVVRFRLERVMLRGTSSRLVVTGALIGLISLAGGVLAHATGPHFESAGDAVWWAFLRLTDPGYLGDDQGVVRRVISTVLTVLGYVLFLGLLVAILTQGLNRTIQYLESGYAPVAISDHVLVLGYTSRTPTLLREIFASEGRTRRFLERQGVRSLHIVVLDERPPLELRYELRDQLGPLYRDAKLTFRAGSSLRLEHLARVDFLHAAAIVLAAEDHVPAGYASSDARVIKTLMSISACGRDAGDSPLPHVVAEIFDDRMIAAARRAYRGDVEVLASDRIVSGLLAQTLHHPGLSHVHGELFTLGEGQSFYIREIPDLAGRPFGTARRCFEHAVPIGVVRTREKSLAAIMRPPPEFVLEASDRHVLLAESYEATEPTLARLTVDPPRVSMRPSLDPSSPRRRLRLLVLGISRKLGPLLRELERFPHLRTTVTVFSSLAVAERPDLRTSLVVRHVQGDFAHEDELREAEPAAHDAVLFLGSDRYEDGAETDARTLVGYVVLKEILDRDGLPSPRVLVELLDAANRALFDAEPVEVIESAQVVGRILAHVTLRPELRVVYDELFGAGGAELGLRPPTDYGVRSGDIDVESLADRVAEHGDVLLGVQSRRADGTTSTMINPAHDARVIIASSDALVVVTESEREPLPAEAPLDAPSRPSGAPPPDHDADAETLVPSSSS